MNLLQCDVLNARIVLQETGIEDDCVTMGWHEGNISLIVRCAPEKRPDVANALLFRTSINVPIAFQDEPVDFKFNFNTAP
jgi:hypothetical protein